MSARSYHRITDTGQIIRCTTTEQLITNPEAILAQLIASASADAPAASAEPAVRCLYQLGDGVSAFRQKIGNYVYYWNSIQLEIIPFQTAWELKQDPAVNDGKHFICPWDGEAPGSFSIGAPMNLQIPEDLIIHFHIEYRRNLSDPDIQVPLAANIPTASAELTRSISRYYLTCFSLSRNTCVSLPLPNLYPDCHLCTGNAFDAHNFFDVKNHSGLVTSTRNFLKTWADTTWNRDLLNGTQSLKMAQYRRFVRFDAATGKQLPFAGCSDWEISTAAVPLEDVYRPWNRDVRAVQPVRRPEDAALTDNIVEAPAEPPPRMDEPIPVTAAAGG